MKYIFSLFIALWSIAAWGQEGGDGFNPSNPGEPGQRYNLTVNVTPDGAGSTSPSGKQQYALGESVYLSANANNYYQFVGWAQDGDTISRSRSFNYTMPAKNTTITAVFKATDSFNPDDPDDPSQEVIKYKLNLTASPIEGGRFNITSGERFSEGTSISVYAYPNSNYQFEGWKQGETLLSTESPYSFVIGKEDVSITGLFRFNPDSPGNPGANHWNAETGELIIDDFTPGSIMNAVSNVVGGSSNYSKVSMVIVSGQMNSYDFGIAQNLSNCTLLDLSRTGGYTEIPSYAFDGTNLSTIILPAGIERIGNYAFRNCKNLTDIICHAITPPTVSNYTFEGIADGAVVHVLASAIPLYTEAPVWKDLTILPLTEDVRTLEVNLPADSEGVYKNMTLELQNLQNGQKQRYVVSDRTSYTFNGLLKNCTYNVSLKTPTGVVLGQIENIEIKDENRSVTFTSLLTLLDVNLQVLTPDGTDVTSQVQITWLDSKQAYLSQGNLLKAQTAGTEIGYRMVLNQDLGMQYVAPENQVYSVKDKENRLVYTLTPIEMTTISGTVKDANGNTLSGAVISISQKLNGKYSKSFITKTDTKGKFAQQIYNAESTISVSATDYVSQTLTKADFSQGTDLGTIELKTIAGATISLNFTYTPSVAAGEKAETQTWYSDYTNISYTIYNVTQGKVITQYSVQYPSIVLLEDVAEGDQLRITASSKTNAFLPVESPTTISAENKADITFNIVGLGGIRASYGSTDNANVAGILYDSKGELLKKYSYTNTSLSISDLADGAYTLVSMSNSSFFNSILKLSSLETSGLKEGTDYILNPITVKSGTIELINNEEIPALDESKLYYTGEGTAFTVNKASIVAGNYLTLKGKIDFKEEYAASVSNVQLVIDLPESCSFVDNSVMTGSQVGAYTIDGNQLTVPMSNYNDQVRFCIIPTTGGTYNPNAFTEFTLNGKTVRQPIGSAYYEVKDLSISVPKTVAKTTIPISGTAQGSSEINIYDNNILIGQTTSLANGIWTTTCELNEPYNLSTHSIHAKVTNKQGLELQSETQEVTYDMNAIEASTVTMTFYNGWLKQNIEVVFDLLKGTTSPSSYMFYTATDITFITNFTNNSPDVISNVKLYVFTDQNEIRPLKATYDEKKDRWIATSKFESNNLPINVSVGFDAITNPTIDQNLLEQIPDMYSKLTEQFAIDVQLLDSISDLDKSIEELEEILYVNGFIDKNDTISDSSFIKYLQGLSDEELDDLIKQDTTNTSEISDSINNAISALQKMYSNEVFFEYDLPDGSKFISKPCNVTSDSLLLDMGYSHYETTEGQYIYTRATEKQTEYIDLSRNCHTIIVSSSTIDQIVKTRSVEDDLKIFNEAIAKINSLYQPIAKAYGDMEKMIGSLVAGLEKELSEANTLFNRQNLTFNMKKVKLERLEKELSLLAPSDPMYNLKKLHVDTYKTEVKEAEKLLKRISKNRALTSTVLKLSRPMKGILAKSIPLVKYADAIYNGLSIIQQFQEIYLSVPNPCKDDEERAKQCRDLTISGAIKAEGVLVVKIGVDALLDIATVGQVVAAGATGGVSIGTAFATAVGKMVAGLAIDAVFNWEIDRRKQEIRAKISQLKCKKCDDPSCNNDDDGDNTPPTPTTPPSSPIHDPSGYVYEAVETNRLQGVTATCYYKEMVEDMYGDLHENIVLWNAAEYAQENPLFTDEKGMYQWDVPQGLWQVKFEKEGYQTTYSEWLPVPPPQLEVNIGMVQTAQPTVTAVRGYETGIEIDFSKFMLPETMTAEFITITRNGEAVTGEVTFKNAEANPQNKNEQFVSKVRFVPSEALATTDKVILTVSKRVKSYAGIQMESDYSQEIAIEKEPKAVVASEIEVVYNETAEITVTVDPAEASTGKKVTATSVSSTIAAIEPAEATLDEEGKAIFTISGELPGQTMIQFAVEGMDMKPEVKVNVVEAGEKNITQNYTLAMGWNWFSINVQDQNLNDIPALLAPIKESVLILKGQNGELTNKNESDWEGSLNSLSTTQAYKIKMKKEATLELTGKGADPTSNTITLNQGWNWIGYVPTVTLPLGQALQNLQAGENDLIKGLDSFAIYDGSAWTGSLTHLLPGEGYMYYSQSVKSFNYAANGTESEPSTPSPQWDYDVHQSEDNMIAIAELYSGEQKAETGKFLVGVFVDGECRGIAVEKDGYLFITAHGEQTDGKLTLRAFDTADQLEYNVKEEIEWSGTLTGSLTTPVSLHIGEATGIIPISEGLLVYPSPVRHHLYIRGDIGNIEEVRISDTAGQTLILDKQVIPGEGINVSSLSKGIYFIMIKTDNEVIQQKFMKID